jgi:hypothetical protein
MRTGLALAVIAPAAVGCAVIAGFPDRSGTFCTGDTHALCEDFDNAGARFAWNRGEGRGEPEVDGGVVPRGRSAPNAWSMATLALEREGGVAAPFIHNFARGPDGLRSGFAFFIDRHGLAEGSPVVGEVGLADGTMILFHLRWATGQVLVTARGGALHAVFSAIDTRTTRPTEGRAIRINERNQALVGEWIDVTVSVDLRKPAVTVSGPDGPQLFTLPAEVKQSADVFTEVLFGAVTLGPAGESLVLFDDLYVDFER